MAAASTRARPNPGRGARPSSPLSLDPTLCPSRGRSRRGRRGAADGRGEVITRGCAREAKEGRARMEGGVSHTRTPDPKREQIFRRRPPAGSGRRDGSKSSPPAPPPTIPPILAHPSLASPRTHSSRQPPNPLACAPPRLVSWPSNRQACRTHPH